MDGNNQQLYGVVSLHIVSLAVDKSAIALVPVIVVPKQEPFLLHDPHICDSTDERSSTVLLAMIDIAEDVSKRYPSTEVVVYIHSSVSRRKIVAAGTDFGLLRFAVQSEFVQNDDVINIVSEVDRRLNPGLYEATEAPVTTGAIQTISNAHTLHNAVASLNPVTVATDGSVHRSYAGGSWGWVADNGEFGYGVLKSADGSLICELSGVEGMLRSMKASNPLIVLVDSKIALRLIDNPDSMKDSSAVSSSCRAIARRIKKKVLDDAERNRPITFRWVKAHNGDVLNEGADRLARNARLASSFSTTGDMTESIAKNIADETVALHKGLRP